MLFEKKKEMKILFKNRKLSPFLIVVATLFLSGCAALGTKTIYKENKLNVYNFNNLGYSQVANEDIINKIRPNTSKIYESAIKEYFLNKPIKIKKCDLEKFNSIDDIDTTEIIKLCTENNLDGYICTQIKYKFSNNYYMYIPLGKSEDAYVSMKLFNKNGHLVLYTIHNTSTGNSYMMPPKAEKTIRDGTIGALKQIFKEIEKAKNR